MKLLRIKLPDSLHARLKVQAAVHQRSMQAIAVDALETLVLEAEASTGRNNSGNAPISNSN